MSTYSSHFRCRSLGRAPSPPTWACYEQIPYGDEYSDDSASDEDDDSCSEDDDDYDHVVPHGHPEDNESQPPQDDIGSYPQQAADGVVGDMDVDSPRDVEKSQLADLSNSKKDIKGKQRAVEPEQPVDVFPPPKKPSHPRRRRQQTHTLRPILTIQKSQGFVWNQDLFVPIYLKDRYIASTSPPNSTGFISSSASFTNSNSFSDYEVDVVEIRLEEGYLNGIIP